MASFSVRISAVGGKDDYLACKAERERGPFYLREAYKSHGRTLTRFGWDLFPHLDQLVSSKLQDNGWLSLDHMPTLWSMGKDTVIDSLLDHRNEGEVMPPKEGLSAQDQLIQHTNRKDTIFP